MLFPSLILSLPRSAEMLGPVLDALKNAEEKYDN
jgi:hypothetical protein